LKTNEISENALDDVLFRLIFYVKVPRLTK
jgi:hypothetical protein